MATPSEQSPTQGVGFPGYCVLSWLNVTDYTHVSVSFLPTLVRLVQPQYAPLQKVNVSINGTVHIFQYGTQELLTWPLEFRDLPWDVQASRNLGKATDGFADLVSFI